MGAARNSSCTWIYPFCFFKYRWTKRSNWKLQRTLHSSNITVVLNINHRPRITRSPGFEKKKQFIRLNIIILYSELKFWSQNVIQGNPSARCPVRKLNITTNSNSVHGIAHQAIWSKKRDSSQILRSRNYISSCLIKKQKSFTIIGQNVSMWNV